MYRKKNFKFYAAEVVNIYHSFFLLPSSFFFLALFFSFARHLTGFISLVDCGFFRGGGVCAQATHWERFGVKLLPSQD